MEAGSGSGSQCGIRPIGCNLQAGFTPCPSPPCPHPPAAPWGCQTSRSSCSCCPGSCYDCLSSAPGARGCGSGSGGGTCLGSGSGSGCDCAAGSAGAARRGEGACRRRRGHRNPSSATTTSARRRHRSLARLARRRRSRGDLCRGAPSRRGHVQVHEVAVHPTAAWAVPEPPRRRGRTAHEAPCLAGRVAGAAGAAGAAGGA